MTLTFPGGPLSTSPPDEANYTIDGPAHRLLMTPFPRRVRAELGGVTILDTLDGTLVHESNMLPMLYVPEADVDTSRLEATDHVTHCPFKGDASYWSVRTGERVVENAVWSYLDPIDGASWLKGRMGCYWDHFDRWFDEDEEVFAHLRDPYHRTDVRASSRRVTVRVGDLVVADSTRAVVLSETGLPNRWYLPREDVRLDLLEPSSTTDQCPYKGRASYWHLSADGADGPRVEDVAWTYEQPFDGVRTIAGRLSFLGDDVEVDVSDLR